MSVGRDTYQSDGTDRNSIQKTKERIRLGGKSLIPRRYWHAPIVDSEFDVSIFAVSDAHPLESRSLIPGTATKGQAVRIYGYPASPTERAAVSNLAMRTHTITSLEQGYFVTEGSEPVTDGFSGGPVLDEQGHVVGMVVRSTGYQVRCMYITDIINAIQRFDSDALSYSD